MPDSVKDLPKGWIKTTIGEVTTPKVKQGIPADKDSIEYIDIASIDNKSKQIVSPKKIEKGKAPSRARQNVCQNDVLVSMTRPNLNAVAKVPAELDGGIASTGFDVLRPILVEPNWLFSYVKSSVFVEAMTQKVQGALYPAVKSVDVRSFEINLPPITEQKRIAYKIESLQAKSKKAKQALETAKPLLDKLRQSILASAFRGDLTADWRKKNPEVEPASVLLKRIRVERRKKWEENELAKMRVKGKEPKDDKWKSKYKEPEPVDTKGLPGLPDGWCWAGVNEFGTVKGGKRLPKGSSLIQEDTGYPYIRAGNLKDGTVKGEILFLKKEDQERISRYIISPKDTYITIVGACIGDTGVITEDFDGANLTENAAKICELLGVDNKYLGLALQSPELQSQIKEKTLSAAQGKLALSRIAQLAIPFCSQEEQNWILKKVNQSFLCLKILSEKVEFISDLINNLNTSVLSKAFQGGLVPQDSNDEPAYKLFDQIKEIQNSLKPKKRVVRKRRK